MIIAFNSSRFTFMQKLRTIYANFITILSSFSHLNITIDFSAIQPYMKSFYPISTLQKLVVKYKILENILK